MENRPPARKVVTRAPWRTVRLINLPGLFPEPIECESSLERDFVYRVALCPSVIDVRHQPLRIALPKGRFYTPDFSAHHADGSTTIVEVKPLSKVRRNAALFDYATRTLREQGHRFLVLTEREIRLDRAHERANFILRHRKSSIDARERQRVFDLFAAMPSASLSVAAVCEQAQVEISCVLHLIASRELFASRTQDFSAGAPLVRRFHEDLHHAIRIHQWFGRQEWSADARTNSRTDADRTAVRGYADKAHAPDQDVGGAQADLEWSISGRSGRRRAEGQAARRAVPTGPA
jgi:hypothetical protein